MLPDHKNTLFYGDNLDILREYIPDESVDLIYLDPPFNSNRNYNVLFKSESGRESEAQITAFDDTWHWGAAAEYTLHQLATTAPPAVSEAAQALVRLLGTNQMAAYLVMMTARLVELHRVLKVTGSLYLHADPTASHYLKILLDAVFGVRFFRRHITWQRSDTHNDARKQYAAVTDHILFYSKSDKHTFHRQYVGFQEKTLRDWYQYIESPDGSVRKMNARERETQQIPTGARRFNADNMASPNPRPNLMYSYKGYPPPEKGWRYSREAMAELDDRGLLLFPKDPNGRIMRKRYLDEQQGAVLGDNWTDIAQIRAVDAERLGYPTQKPIALLERIIQASSNPGDVVLDPFAGCGTAIDAAQKLGRNWIGIDITSLSTTLLKSRLFDRYELRQGADYQVVGEPVDLEGARALAAKEGGDRYQFQWWALGLIRAQPLGGTGGKQGKKGSDRGVDGLITFSESANRYGRVIVQVKSGGVKSGDIRDLRGTLDREGAAIGLFITLERPTRDMLKEAPTAGFYTSPGWHTDYPRLQILTIEELLAGKGPRLPPVHKFNQAARASSADPAHQASYLDPRPGPT